MDTAPSLQELSDWNHSVILQITPTHTPLVTHWRGLRRVGAAPSPARTRGSAGKLLTPPQPGVRAARHTHPAEQKAQPMPTPAWRLAVMKSGAGLKSPPDWQELQQQKQNTKETAVRLLASLTPLPPPHPVGEALLSAPPPEPSLCLKVSLLSPSPCPAFSVRCLPMDP